MLTDQEVLAMKATVAESLPQRLPDVPPEIAELLHNAVITGICAFIDGIRDNVSVDKS